MKFLSLKELHRLPPLPQGKTSAQARYLTATTTAAQRLRAVGETRQNNRRQGPPVFAVLHATLVSRSVLGSFKSSITALVQGR